MVTYTVTSVGSVATAFSFLKRFWRESALLVLMAVCSFQYSCIRGYRLDIREAEIKVKEREATDKAAAERLDLKLEDARLELKETEAELNKRLEEKTRRLEEAEDCCEMIEIMVGAKNELRR